MCSFKIKILFFIVLLSPALSLFSYSNSDVTTDCNSLIIELCDLTLTTGSLKVNNDTLVYYIYSKVGDLIIQDDSYFFNSIPLIGINGGPGSSHDYLEPLKRIACLGTPLILYDQIGTGNSTRVTDLKEFQYLLTIEHYIEELRTLINHLDLDKVHIMGHSWGTIVAQEFAILQPKELIGLILSGALSDSQLYIDSQRRVNLAATLPHHVLEIIQKADETQIYNSSDYLAVDDILTFFFTSRTIPIADCMVRSDQYGNNDIYVQMQGASEFTVGGVLANWNITGKLHLIEAETLVTRGEYDTMTEECSQTIINQLKNGRKLITIPKSGHIQMIDENEVYVNEVLNFIKSVEEKRNRRFLEK